MPIPSIAYYKLWEFTEKKDAERISSQTPSPGIKEITAIPYVDDGSWEHLLDFYYKDDGSGNIPNSPLIIDIHGGGWMYGTKEINKYYCFYLASKGFNVFSINYTLCPKGTFKTQIQDAFSAFRWIGEHGAEYNCDMQNVFLCGDSAGGHIATVAAALYSRPDLCEIYDVELPAFSLNALGIVCGAYDIKLFKDLEPGRNYAKIILGDDYKNSDFANVSSMSEIIGTAPEDTKLPPIYMVSSKEDFIGFLSTGFDKLMTRYGYTHTFRRLGKSKLHSLPHVFCVTNPEYPESQIVNTEMLDFFRKYIV